MADDSYIMEKEQYKLESWQWKNAPKDNYKGSKMDASVTNERSYYRLRITLLMA